MAVSAEKIDKGVVTFDPLTEALEKNNGVTEMRSKIHALLDRFEEEKFATTETVKQYREAAEVDPTFEGLQGFYKWIAESWFGANNLLRKLRKEIDSGIQSGVMGKTDREFLMEHLILTDDQDFIGQTKEIEKVLREKIARLKDDRKAYDRLIDHPLIKNTGIIKIDAQTKIEIPDEKEFLSLTVPERRKLLKKAKDSLPKAEKYAEKQSRIEFKELLAEYTDLLEDARAEKVMGEKTIKKYLDGFKKIDNQEKAYWIKELKNGNQLKRYRELWGSIRSTLKGPDKKPDLDYMESLRDKMGWSQLFAEFGRMRAKSKKEANRETDPQSVDAKEPTQKTDPPKDQSRKDHVDKILSSITNTTVKSNVIDINEELDPSAKKEFAKRIEFYLSKKIDEKEDASSYEKSISAARLNQQKAYKKGDAKVKTTMDEEFEQNTFKDEKGVKRIARVGSTKQAIQAFNNEMMLNPNKDELFIMVRNGDKEIRLNTREMRTLAKVLKVDEGEEKKKVA